jgi:hypothetical protein
MAAPRNAKARVEVLFTLWAKHDKMRSWSPLMTGLAQQVALDEMIERQDRLRRTGDSCQFRVRPDGQSPDERRS